MPCDLFNPVRCLDCPKEGGKYIANLVPPDMGESANGDIVFIGEAPGKDEDEQGRPFVGKTGKELNQHYLWLAGLDRDRIYLTNTVKCRPRNNTKPSDKLRESCAEWHLSEEINTLKPRFVVLMGSTACALVEGVSLDLHHGLPLKRTLFGHECTVIPMWHPAAGIHDTKLMLPLRQDFKRMRYVVRGTYEGPTDPYPNPDYQLLQTRYDLNDVMTSLPNWDGYMAIDTETLPGRIPYCLTFSCKPGTGYMILASNPDLLSEFRRYVKLWRGKFVFHNYAYDGDILPGMEIMPRAMVCRPAPKEVMEKLGFDIRMDRIEDTMIRAYNLGRFLRVGLKILAYRELGVEMQEFEDLVLPYAFDKAYDYLSRVKDIDWPKPEPVYVPTPEGGKRAKNRHGINTRIKRLFTDLEKCDGSQEKMKAILIERWDDWDADIVLPVIERLGDIPEPSIEQVPINEQIRYACRDADVTLRLLPKLLEYRDELVERTREAA